MSCARWEDYQFDWSHETITLQVLPLTIKAAHMKLSHSRMPFVRAYFRETQELVLDAHDKAFVFYGGVCRRGIYDNMKTRSEEHTSELQSLMRISYAVFCLKKNSSKTVC